MKPIIKHMKVVNVAYHRAYPNGYTAWNRPTLVSTKTIGITGSLVDRSPHLRYYVVTL